MTPHEAEALEWSLVALNEAAYQLRCARIASDGPDVTEELERELHDAQGDFIGKTRIYTTPADEYPHVLLALARELAQAHAQGEATYHYGAVLGAIRAMKETP
ncbi:hypothetical protein [uncultured Stenotrophomonas sp.]|uniref:hypothetical protein n=1 Tax=uncultured Stenotrophomonas sp. TaxID=165438 RepID=UPI0025CE6ACD|nr:hypothetical protein [uncultured Stenotrophomonas sp.]